MRYCTLLGILFWSMSMWAVQADPAWLQQLLEIGDNARYEHVLCAERSAHHVSRVQPRHPRLRAPQSAVDGTVTLAPRGLVVLINFQDVQFRAGNTREMMDSMLNARTYTYNGAIGSARQYFVDQSDGQYEPQFDVVGPVTLPQPVAYYGRDNGDTIDARLGDMVLHACSIAATLPEVDFSRYDNNNDGVVDLIYFIHAGFSQAEGGGENCIWAAQWDVPSAIYEGYVSGFVPGDNGDYLDTARYSFQGKAIGSFAYSQELRGNSGSTRAGIGTFCHEFSHVLGLPDYYDIYYGSNNENRRTPGAWSLMASGSYNCNGNIPAGYSGYDKWFLGWLTPSLLVSPENVVLPADGQTVRYINAAGQEQTARSTSSMCVLENRQQMGWDQGLPGHGLLIWNITYDEDVWEKNEVNASASNERSPIVNTSGRTHLTLLSATGNLNQIGTDADPFPGTHNVSNVTLYRRLTLSQIQEQSGQVSFSFMGGIASEEEALETTTQLTTKTFQNGQIVICRDGKEYTLLGQQIR